MRVFWLLFLPAAVYQCLAIFAAVRHLQRRRNEVISASFTPAVSVLKPLRGLDPNTYEAFVSQISQDYPEFEVLFGVRDGSDAAALEVVRLQKEFGSAPVQLVVGGTDASNGKVGLLCKLSQRARFPVRVVNDSDIKVDSGYLAAVTAPLADPSIGVVTCLYRVKAHTVAAAWEALGIMTDFMPSTMVAQLIGVREFGLGSTLAFRAADLERAGGFESFGAFIADDYQLAKRITSLGKRVLLSTYTVETSLGDASWGGIWRHQLRWARTIRLSKGGGYAGLPITHAGVWVTVAIISGAWLPAAILLSVRVLSALLSGAFVLNSRLAANLCWLSPLWDLYSFTIWITSYFGRTVRWRDRTLSIDNAGRIEG